ncbi:MAG: radical SAM protein [Dictyoglomus sp.]|nr:radical SAM protein [Dictyoglomus sp.]MCX7941615.1 radical SAM protein [Dictyoglomaceae bacterium]MDW8187766.1 radical SAM protein [Dictyoglomus sp.]
MKIGISYGCLEILKKGKIREDSPKTLYLLASGKCQKNCAFCTQARESNDSLYLSRIIWPNIEEEELFSLLKAKRDFFYRICIQTTKTEFWKKNIKSLISKLKIFNLPISLSAPVENMKEVDELFELGIERMNISIDVADRELYFKIKEQLWEDKINLIKNASKKYKERITTHIIVGLGEKEKFLLEIINELIKNKITIALFAFTPLPGTKLENKTPPDYLTYRKIQIITFLLQRNLINFENLRFDKKERLIIEDWWLNKSYYYFQEIFLTMGCPNCNRPYYNESPRITPYNFPREIKQEEIITIKNLLNKGKCFNLRKI